jgi:hypothetical protein
MRSSGSQYESVLMPKTYCHAMKTPNAMPLSDSAAAEPVDMLTRDLIEAVRTRSTLLIVGAGVSAAGSNGNPLARWHGLLSNDVERAAYAGTPREPSPKEWIERRKLDLMGVMPDRMAVAEQVSSRLRSRSGGFARWLNETVGSLPLADATVRSWRTLIATTNYDDLLERRDGATAEQWDFTTQNDQHEVLGILEGKMLTRVLHIHGHCRRPETVVLGVRDYERHVTSGFVDAFQRYALMRRTVVFVGFGAGLEDPNFSLLLHWYGETLEKTTQRHYRLCLNHQVTDPYNGIHAISYGTEYKDLTGFLNRVADAATLDSDHGSTSQPDARQCATFDPSGAQSKSFAASRVSVVQDYKRPADEFDSESPVLNEPRPLIGHRISRPSRKARLISIGLLSFFLIVAAAYPIYKQLTLPRSASTYLVF